MNNNIRFMRGNPRRIISTMLAAMMCFSLYIIAPLNTGATPYTAPAYTGYDYVERFNGTGTTPTLTSGATLTSNGYGVTAWLTQNSDGVYQHTLSSTQGGHRAEQYTLGTAVAAAAKQTVEFDWIPASAISSDGTAVVSVVTGTSGGSSGLGKKLVSLYAKGNANTKLFCSVGDWAQSDGGGGPATGTTAAQLSGTFTLNQWYHVKIEIAYGDKVNVTVTGLQTTSSTGTASVSASGLTQSAINRIQFDAGRMDGSSSNQSATFSVDNIGITRSTSSATPTPAPTQQPSTSGKKLDGITDRGLVAVKVGTGVYMSWRLFPTDPSDTQFNVYRTRSGATTKLNSSPLAISYNDYTDTSGTATDTYQVSVIKGGVEGAKCAAVTPWTTTVGTASSTTGGLAGYKEIAVQKPTGHLSNVASGSSYTDYVIGDASVGDINGDGKYEIVFLWTPNNAQDNAYGGLTANVYIDAYSLETGAKIWGSGKWIDLGQNIRAGAHYSPFLVYDFNEDGKAEIIIKTAPGTKDTTGRLLGGTDGLSTSGTGDGNPNTCFAITNGTDGNGGNNGKIISGNEYLSVFEGATGKLLDSIPYNPPRGTYNWGDSYGNRVDRFLAAVAYLDGVHPTAIFTRGYYTRTCIWAVNWNGTKLTQKWFFDTSTAGSQYEAKGNHNLSIADVDSDGKDEIIFGSLTLTSNGTVKYAHSGDAHGDAMHVGKLLPDRSGLVLLKCFEALKKLGVYDANTGSALFEIQGSADVGRCLSGSIDPSLRGEQVWGPGGSSNVVGVWSADGTKQSATNPNPSMVNMAIYWDGDTGRELEDGSSTNSSMSVPTISKVSVSGSAPSKTYTANALIKFTGTDSNAGTKANPVLQADLIGDWREEIVLRSADSKYLRIYTTTAVEDHTSASGKIPAGGIPMLMSNPQYRLAVAWQNVGYNQPPHTSYYIGYNMKDSDVKR